MARLIAPLLEECDGTWVEPFVGGFNLLPAMRTGRGVDGLCNDLHPGLATLYTAVRDGWEPPRTLSRDEYEALRKERDWSRPVTAFAAFGCSYGGREFQGYASNSRGDDYALATRRSLLRKKPSMTGVQFTTMDYRELVVPEGALVYLDPPYRDTKGYVAGRMKFDTAEMVAWAENVSATRGAHVFLSETSAPPGWRVLWAVHREVQVGRRHGLREVLSAAPRR